MGRGGGGVESTEGWVGCDMAGSWRVSPKCDAGRGGQDTSTVYKILVNGYQPETTLAEHSRDGEKNRSVGGRGAIRRGGRGGSSRR